jgi:hypothetical protein
MSLLQLPVPLEVTVVAETLPQGVKTKSRKATCLGWWMTDEICLWNVVFHETGELCWVPMKEIRMRANWSAGRRY